MGKKEDKKDFEVKLKWKHLERIAAYYEFPVAVFLAETLPMKGTRKDRLLANARGFIEEIKDVYDKWWG